MSYASVNDTMREMMSALKKEWNRSHYTISSAGTATAYTLTYTTAPPAYVTGMTFTFKVHAANTGTATLNVNSLGAKSIRLLDGTIALSANMLPLSSLVTVVYDGTQFVILSVANYPAGWKLVGRLNVTSPSGDQTFALPAQFTEFELQIESAVPASSTPAFIRYSNDNGVSYKQAAGDYGAHYLEWYSTTVAADAPVTPNIIQISSNQSTSTGYLRGSVRLTRGTGHANFWTEGFDTTPSSHGFMGSGNIAFAGPITNVSFGFIGQNISSAVLTLMGRV